MSARTSSGRQNQPQGIQQVSYHVLYPYYKLNNAPGSAPSNAKHSASHIRKTNRTFDDGSARLNANLDRLDASIGIDLTASDAAVGFLKVVVTKVRRLYLLPDYSS